MAVIHGILAEWATTGELDSWFNEDLATTIRQCFPSSAPAECWLLDRRTLATRFRRAVEFIT
jgi:hypothetical protein